MPDSLRSVPEPVLYLEALMAPMLAEQLGLQLIELPMDWLPKLPEPYRKRRVRLSTLGAARLLEEPAFIKPPNDKSFPAKVYRWRELPAEFPDDTAVLVAEVVEWEKEFRCFVLDRRVADLFSLPPGRRIAAGKRLRSHGARGCGTAGLC